MHVCIYAMRNDVDEPGWLEGGLIHYYCCAASRSRGFACFHGLVLDWPQVPFRQTKVADTTRLRTLETSEILRFTSLALRRIISVLQSR
jgi:hypothetical protein